MYSKVYASKSTFGFNGEGWGLTHDGRRLIISDGTSTSRFLDADGDRLFVTGKLWPRLFEIRGRDREERARFE